MKSKNNYRTDMLAFRDSMYFKKVQVLSYDIEFPQIIMDIPNREYEKINKYYNRKANKNLSFIKGNMFLLAKRDLMRKLIGPFYYYEISTNFNVETQTDKILSISSNYNESIIARNDKTINTSETWDLSTGKRIELHDLFPNCDNYKDYIIREIQKKISLNLDMYYPNALGLAEKYFNPNNFFISNSVLVIYYQIYRISSKKTGIVKFEINIEDMNEALAKMKK